MGRSKKSAAAKKRLADRELSEVCSTKRAATGTQDDLWSPGSKVGRPCTWKAQTSSWPEKAHDRNVQYRNVQYRNVQYRNVQYRNVQYRNVADSPLSNSQTSAEKFSTNLQKTSFQTESPSSLSRDSAIKLSSNNASCMNEPNVTNECVTLTQPDFPERSFLTGSFHQGDVRFGNVGNKQCGAISLTAVLKSKMKNVWTWETGDLDDVLIKGTLLYKSMSAHEQIRDHVEGRGYIAVSELPRQHRVWNCDFALNFGDSYTGFVCVDNYDPALCDVALPFDEALQRALFTHDACLLTICGNTCAIVNGETRFAFVNSHANTWVNHKGQRVSCVSYFSSAQSLVSFVYDYAQSFGVSTPRFEEWSSEGGVSERCRLRCGLSEMAAGRADELQVCRQEPSRLHPGLPGYLLSPA
ncbi:uncharacterized protein PAE49_014642 [Odontesthes bonariensis]